MAQIITYATPSGETIDLTTAQINRLAQAGYWPRNERGEEYCQVQHGLHRGKPTSSLSIRAQVKVARALASEYRVLGVRFDVALAEVVIGKWDDHPAAE